MPEIVTLSSTGDSLVDYTAVIPVLVQAVKELDATIQQLELQLDEKANLSDLQNNKNLTSKSLLSNAVMNQNTPNPFNSTTNISFTIPTSARSAFISICNLQGTQVKKFDIATRGEGSIMVSFYVYVFFGSRRTVDLNETYAIGTIIFISIEAIVFLIRLSDTVC